MIKTNVVTEQIADPDEQCPEHGCAAWRCDDGYQGPQAASTLTAEQQEAVDLMFQIAGLEDSAQNAEDREQLGKASSIRAKIRPLAARLAALKAVAS